MDWLFNFDWKEVKGQFERREYKLGYVVVVNMFSHSSLVYMIGLMSEPFPGGG